MIYLYLFGTCFHFIYVFMIIGKNVWVGEKVTVLPGVHIGEGSIIGANSVVTHDIPPYSIAVGIPAKVIKTVKS